MLHQQVLVLEVDDPLAVRALNIHLAVVKALGLRILLLDDLAARQETAFNPSLCKGLKGVRAVLCTPAQLMTDLLTQGHSAAGQGLLDVTLPNHPTGETGDLTKGGADPASDLLAHGRVLGVIQFDGNLVVFAVCHCQRRCIQPVDMQQQGVQRRHRTARAVTVDKGNVVEQRDQHGAERVKAAQLHRNRVFQLTGRIHLGAHLLQCIEGVDRILREVDIFQHSGRTHTGGNSAVSLRIHVAGFQKRQLHRLFRMELFVGVQQICATYHGTTAAAAH